MTPELRERYRYVLNSQIKNRFGKTLRVICVPRDMIEDSICLSGDGLEKKMIAFDIISKLQLFLTERQFKIIAMKYFGNMTYTAIGDALGIHQTTAIYQHNKGIKKIRKSL